MGKVSDASARNQRTPERAPFFSSLTAERIRSWLTPQRIGLLAVGVVVLIVLAMELQTRSAWSSTRQAVGAALAQTDHGLYRKELPKYLRGSPARKRLGETADEYTWNGLVKSYHMRLQYTRSGLVQKASWY